MDGVFISRSSKAISLSIVEQRQRRGRQRDRWIFFFFSMHGVDMFHSRPVYKMDNLRFCFVVYLIDAAAADWPVLVSASR